MSMSSTEARDLRNIAASMKKMESTLATVVRILEAVNKNLVAIGRDPDPTKAEKDGSYSVVRGDGSVVYTKHPEDLGVDPEQLNKQFIATDEGRMLPSEWRHNLQINNIRVLKPDSKKLMLNENRPMTQKQFRDYNSELHGSGIIAFDPTTPGSPYLPDDRGRMKPREWRHKLGIAEPSEYDLRRVDNMFDEGRMMTQEVFEIYNRKLGKQG